MIHTNDKHSTKISPNIDKKTSLADVSNLSYKDKTSKKLRNLTPEMIKELYLRKLV